MLDFAIAADISRPRVVACALYRDGQRVRDIAVEEIGASAGRDASDRRQGVCHLDPALR
jgi:hypothetical protein